MPYAKDVTRIALGEVGYREKRVNHTKFADEVKTLNWAQNQPWCHTFISWTFQKADARDIAPCTASCAAGVQWFKKQSRFSQTPHVGDIVYYGRLGGTHVELVVAVTESSIKTVGGNTTGNDEDGNYFNGDGVYEKWVPRNSSRIYGYGHPDYEVERKSPPVLKRGSKGAAVKVWQGVLIEQGFEVVADGVFGSSTEKATKEFQRLNEIKPDGVVGPITRSKV